MHRLCCLMFLGAALLMGCGEPEPQPVDVAQQGKLKVEAFKAVANALLKDPNSMEARAALEDFRNHALDPEKNRPEAEEILQIYRQRLQGKVRGQIGDEVQMEVLAIQGTFKPAR